MFGWFKRKKEVDLPKKVWQEETLVQVKPTLSAADYNRRTHKVYWETWLNPDKYGWNAEIRFMGFDGTLVETHHVEGPTKQNVEGLVEKLVIEKMENFKVK